ncbi:putative polyketide synthase [Xylariaceae sp. FL1651]|nr:putative polyketide synthase [Xylariaceae sp. FL1651]
MPSHTRFAGKPRLEEDDNAIAICGFSLKFPGDAVSSELFWKMMEEKRCAMTPFPANRFNGKGFYQKKSSVNTIPVQGGHFIQEDLSAFDADFFSISSVEASSIDPMQRWLLETAFRALENAGITMNSVAGSLTSVYTGSFGLDYGIQINRDAECPPTHAGLGFGISMLANRLSWFFDLRGPSVGLDSACSSSAMAIDMACQALNTKSCNMSMVAGCNLTFSPETYTWLSNLHFLSPDSRCYSFDHRANGYARGEGIGVIILKRVSDAIRDGNTIRAVIRSTLSNEDGRTPGITQPSSQSQERLIRETYRRAGLSMEPTRYFEAHGTGTAIGDPCEARAIGSSFEDVRSSSDPIFVGAVKSNIGHLEGASGLAGVIKTVLVLEKGIIPPNSNFERLNPKIDAHSWGLQFPDRCYPWPSNGLRRASVNSFGYGGANCHIILDDAYHYLCLRSLVGRHCTEISVPSINGVAGPKYTPLNGAVQAVETSQPPKLLVWTSADENGLSRIAKQYRAIDHHKLLHPLGWKRWLGDLAYTLEIHRTHLPWRSFALVQSPIDLQNVESRMSVPVRVDAEKPPRIGFVFSGQGAQWAGMGRELIHYSSFNADLLRADKFLRSLGCGWSVVEELSRTDKDSNIDHPELSQALCTILQVALVNLLLRFGITPYAVVGHSSGEIAAAYAGGYISIESAWKLAYFRGICSSQLYEASRSGVSGSMISAGISEERARDLIADFEHNSLAFGVATACVNSPENVTIAGEDHIINKIHRRLENEGLFARKLRVPLAYHSRQMEAISAQYAAMVGFLCGSQKVKVPMISSVTGKRATSAQLTDPEYWVLNMVSTVRFSQAVTNMCAQSSISLVKKIDLSHDNACVVDHLLEVGPHAALQAPVREILKTIPRGAYISYGSVLKRPLSAVDTMLNTLGSLHSRGIAVNLRAANEPSELDETMSTRALLVDLPEYPFDHSQSYWHESRLSRNYRFRERGPSKFLGVRSPGWDPADARWRHFLRIEDLPWAEQHVINGVCLYPGAGMLVMAIEAASELAEGSDKAVSGYILQDVQIEAPMDLSAGPLEVQTSLRQSPPLSGSEMNFKFTIRSFLRETWTLNCQGSISVEFFNEANSWNDKRTQEQRVAIARQSSSLRQKCETKINCDAMYRYLKEHSLDYGPLFQVARQQRCNDSGQAAAEIVLVGASDDEEREMGQRHVVHPILLDALMHLCFTAFTAGGSREMATSVPSRINSLWVSNKGLRSSKSSYLMASTDITSISERGFSCSGVGLDSEHDEEIRLWYEGLELTNLSDPPIDPPPFNPRQFCMNVDCKIALNKLSSAQVHSVLEELHPAQEKDPTHFFEELELLIESALVKLKGSICASELNERESWTKHYWNWAEHHLSRRGSRGFQASMNSLTNPTKSLGFQELCDRLEKSNPVGRLYVAVARNLIGMLRGEINPLELLALDDILKNYYETLTSYRCALQISSYMDLLVHERAGLNLLEVGGGTGAGTRNITRALGANPGTPGTFLRCNRYDFTDVSAAFLGKAREEFKAYESQMTFGTLDIERDFSEQGYQEGEYDVVLAVSVLHITADLKQTLLNIRKAMKPGGKLVMQESFKPDGWTLGFVFGVFPGWWFGSEDNRALSPSITLEAWDTILREVGFSGIDLVLRDFSQEVAHHYGWVISTAVSGVPLDAPQNGIQSRWSHHVTIIVDSSSAQQQLLASELEAYLRQQWRTECVIVDFVNFPVHQDRETSGLLIFLADYGTPFLAALTKETWGRFQHLIQGYDHCLWVSGGGGRGANPEYGMVDGLARTLRRENPSLHLVTLALDAIGPDPSNKTSLLLLVLSEMVARTSPTSYEEEYVEVDGFLHTRRLVDANYVKLSMNARLAPYEISSLPLGIQVPFTMSTGSRGKKDTPHYVASAPLPDLSEEDSVDVAVKAVALQSHGRSRNQRLGGDVIWQSACAGMVLRAGSQTNFSIGDRVFVAYGSSFSSHIRVSFNRVAKIPPHITFSDACRYIPPRIIAFHALIEVGQTHLGKSILVHNGSSLIGRSAIQLAAERGVSDLWATAAEEEESFLMTQTTGLAADHILPSSWFDSNPMMISQWKERFSLVFSASATRSESLLSQCVVPGGQYLVQCHMSILSGDGKLVGCAASKPSPSVPQDHEIVRAHIPSRESLEYACGLSHSSISKDAEPCTSEFPASELDRAIDGLRNMQDEEPVIMNLDNADTVEIRRAVQPGYELDENATFVVCGGLGGLGQAIARWLVSRGARNLILLSRSGPQTPEARNLIRELAQSNVRVEAPRCDVADRSSLRTVLAECLQRLPPVKGCIQAAMVMRESVFQKMDYDDWKDAVAPKVQASWNLHLELPDGLDFFIMLSSVMGIFGTGSLAGYNAGNTYQDALARFRVACGERAAALDIGGVVDGGYLTGLTSFIAGMQRAKEYVPLMTREVCGLLDLYCDPSTTFTAKDVGCQAVVGIRPPAYWKGSQAMPRTMQQPLWGHMHHVPLPQGHDHQAEGPKTGPSDTGPIRERDIIAKLVATGALSEAGEVACQALVDRVSTMLGTPASRIDKHKAMHSYGIDSLSAIDLRNWVGKIFDVDLPVFEILGGANFISAGSSLVRRMK